MEITEIIVSTEIQEQKDKVYIESLESYITEANGRVKYSLDRFDILIITLSSGGLALGATLYENFNTTDKSLLGLAWTLFSAALIINLKSQITGYWANKLDIKCTRMLINEIKGKLPEGTHKKLDKYKKISHNLTSFFNGLSFVSLTTAIILIIIFVNTKA